LRSLMVGEDGMPLLERETHKFRVGAFNHTLAPRDAICVEYALDVPDELPALPLRVGVRLRHRSRGRELAAAACADTRTPRGKAFADNTDRRGGKQPLDACVEQPITDVAETETFLGDGWQAR